MMLGFDVDNNNSRLNYCCVPDTTTLTSSSLSCSPRYCHLTNADLRLSPGTRHLISCRTLGTIRHLHISIDLQRNIECFAVMTDRWPLAIVISTDVSDRATSPVNRTEGQTAAPSFDGHGQTDTRSARKQSTIDGDRSRTSCCRSMNLNWRTEPETVSFTRSWWPTYRLDNWHRLPCKIRFAR